MKFALILIILLSTFCLWASPSKTLDYDFGAGAESFKWGVEIANPSAESDLHLRIGTRLQGMAVSQNSTTGNGTQAPTQQDFYINRARLQVLAKMRSDMSFYMDVRADGVDQINASDNGFALGDAYFQVENLWNYEPLSLRVFRSKYQVSYSQTSSSADLLHQIRASVSDYSASFISTGRRASNLQLLANWSNRLRAQIVVGDSLQEAAFFDALGLAAATLNSQNFAYGARLRASPLAGWELKKITETFLGQGQHFAVGAGAFFVDNINYTVGSISGEVDRQLFNFDLSFHYRSFSFLTEYSLFDGVIESFASQPLNTGKSEGAFAQVEYVLTDFHYLAPFARWQSWNRFKENTDFNQSSWLVGLNHYLKGNKLRWGAYFEKTDYGAGLTATNLWADHESVAGLTFMLHY